MPKSLAWFLNWHESCSSMTADVQQSPSPPTNGWFVTPPPCLWGKRMSGNSVRESLGERKGESLIGGGIGQNTYLLVFIFFFLYTYTHFPCFLPLHLPSLQSSFLPLDTLFISIMPVWSQLKHWSVELEIIEHTELTVHHSPPHVRKLTTGSTHRKAWNWQFLSNSPQNWQFKFSNKFGHLRGANREDPRRCWCQFWVNFWVFHRTVKGLL